MKKFEQCLNEIEEKISSGEYFPVEIDIDKYVDLKFLSYVNLRDYVLITAQDMNGNIYQLHTICDYNGFSIEMIEHI